MRLLKLLSIRNFLVLLVLLASAPIFLFSMCSVQDAKRQVLASVSRGAEETAQKLTATQQLLDVFLIARLRSLASVFASQKPDLEQILSIFKKEADFIKDIVSDILLIDSRGNVAVSLRPPEMYVSADFLPSGNGGKMSENYSHGLSPFVGKTLVWTDADGETEYSLPFVQMFETEAEDGEHCGVAMLLNLACLKNLLRHLFTSGVGMFCIVDTSGEVLYTCDSPFIDDSEDQDDKIDFTSVWARINPTRDSGSFLLSSPKGALFAFGYSRVRFSPSAPAHAVTIVSFPTQERIQRENLFFLRGIFLTLSSTLIGLLLALGVGRRFLAAPVEKLAQAHKRFALGDLSSRAGIDKGLQEMLLLSSTFDDMASVLEAQEIHRRLETEAIKEQAHRDYLTGAWNRRAGLMTMERLMAESREHKLPLAVFFIDIDFFKQINDEYGHNEGDKMLRRVTLLLERYLRVRDVLCRYGGDEFLVLLPGCTYESAEDVWLRIEKEILRVDTSGGLPYTFSLSHGIAVFNPLAPTPLSLEELIAEADAKMYAEKQKRGAHR